MLYTAYIEDAKEIGASFKMSKKNQSEGNKWLRKAAIIIAWLIAWQIISVCVDNTILLVGPVTTFGVLLEKVAEISFWKTVQAET